MPVLSIQGAARDRVRGNQLPRLSARRHSVTFTHPAQFDRGVDRTAPSRHAAADDLIFTMSAAGDVLANLDSYNLVEHNQDVGP